MNTEKSLPQIKQLRLRWQHNLILLESKLENSSIKDSQNVKDKEAKASRDQLRLEEMLMNIWHNK